MNDLTIIEYPTITGISFWIFIRLFNNFLNPKFIEKRKKFNLPTHFQQIPIVFHYLQLCIDATILMLGAPLRRFPRIQSERFLMGGICLLSLNIVSIFQSQLSTCYVRPMYYKNINTLQQFADTERKIVVKYPAMMKDIFPEDTSELYKTLNQRLVLVANNEQSATDFTDRYGMAGVTRRMTLKLSHENNKVHLIPECPRSYNLAYIHVKHWVFTDKLNDLILRLIQSGILNKWVNDINFKVILDNINNFEFTVHHRSLTVDDLMLSFMILGFGGVLGLVLLILEHLFYRRCQHRKKTH